jgi:hypothetical protein
MDVEGIPSLSARDYDFNTGNHSAYEGDIGTIPPGSQPSNYDDKSLDANEIKNIKSGSDNAVAQYNFDESGGGNITTGRPYHMFKFIIADSSPYRFTFYWTGEGYARTGAAGSVNEVYTYFFSTQNTSWDKVSYVSQSSPGNVKLTVNQGVGKASNYVGTGNSVYVMVVGPSVTSGLTKGYIATDYVKLTVHSGGSEYPSNVKLDLGADGGTADWTHSGQLDTKVTLDDSKNFKSSIQGEIDAAGTDEGDFTMVLGFSTTTGGSLRISNLNIQLETLEHNDPPEVIVSQLGHFYMTEDAPASGDNLIDLKLCFMDDHDSPSTLRYELPEDGDGDPATLEAAIDPDGYHLDFTPAADFSGTVMFRVTAVDAGADEIVDTFDDLSRISHFFNVTVQPVNDAPVFEAYTDVLAVNESETLKFNLKVNDIDDTVFTWDSNNTEKVLIVHDAADNSKARIEVTPDEYDVGKDLMIMVTATDSGGGQSASNKLTAHTNLTIDVINLNNPPSFVELTLLPDQLTEKAVANAAIKYRDGQAAVEDEYYNISVSATDPDLDIEPMEVLTFSVSHKEGEIDGDLAIDPLSGLLSFVPVNEDVGTVEFTITVTDWMGESADQDVELEVRNRNDAPRDVKILEPEERSFETEDEIDFVGECYDDDLDVRGYEEVLTFMWFTNHSSTPLGQGDEIYNIKLNAGVHEITLKVIDAKGEFITTSIELSVKAPYVPPPPDDKKDDEKKDDDTNLTQVSGGDKSGNTVYLALLAIVIIVVVVIAIFFVVMRPKMKKQEEDQEAVEKAAAELPPIPPMPGMMQQAGYAPMQQMPGAPMQYGGMQPQYGMMPQMQQPQQVPQLPPQPMQPAQIQPAQVQHVPQAAVQQPVKEAVVQSAPQPAQQTPFTDPNAINVEVKKPNTPQ